MCICQLKAIGGLNTIFCLNEVKYVLFKSTMSSWLLSSCLGVCVAWSWLGIILAFLLVYFGGQGNILCSALLPAFTVPGLLQGNFQHPQVSIFLLHLYASAFACAHSFTVLHTLGILAYFRVFFFPLNSWFSGWVLGLELGVAGRAHGSVRLRR